MKVFLARHGETDRNRAKLLQGRSDIPLNSRGTEQAEMLREFFRKQGIRFDSVYSSPLQRAVMTAQIACGGECRIITDERLLEMDYGPYEGSSLEHPSKEILEFFRDFVHNPAPEGMESLAHVTHRMGQFLEELKQTDAENVLIASHAIAVKGALEYLTPGACGKYWSEYIGTCSVYRTELKDGIYGIPEEVYSLNRELGV
ncbi:MAG: histidine phosphatase family protein [Solobacterium sp.]|nr:histidine phosphatase family protein [Solobacterium sp.]